MSPDDSLEARDLIDLSPAELLRRFEEGGREICARVAESFRNEAALHYHSDPGRALRIATRAVEWSSLGNDPLAMAWSLRARAEALLFSGRMAEAEGFYARAVDAARRARSPGLLGQILVARTHLLAMLGRYRDAESAARSARRNLEAAGDDAYLAKLAMNLGSVHFQREQYRRAMEEYDRAASIFARSGIRDATALGLEVNRGVVLSQLDRDEESLTLFRKLESECEEAGQELLLAQVRMNAAVVRSQRGEFDIALGLLAGAAAYFRQADHPAFLASCLLNRAEIYQQLNLAKEGGDLAAESVPLFIETGLGFDAALARTQCAISRLELGDLKESLAELGRARRVFAREKNAIRVSFADLLRAEILRRRGRRDEALELVRVVIGRFREDRLLRWESVAAIVAARLEMERGEPQAAVSLLENLLARIAPRIYPIPALQATILLSEAQERTGSDEAAHRSLRLAARRLEDLRIRIPTEDSKIAFLSDKAHLYDRLIATELRRSRPSVGRLFDWMEESREQSLRDRLRSPARFIEGEVTGSTTALPGEESARMRRRLAWLHARLSRLELEGAARRSQAAAVRRRLRAEETAWARAVREAGESGAALARGQVGRGGHGRILEAVAASLEPGWGFLSYHLSPGASLAIAITSGGARWRRLDLRAHERAAALADRLDFQWATAAANSIRPDRGNALRGLRRAADAILAECSREFWDPLETLDLPRETRWIVSPHGALHRIPFHALRPGAGYLAERIDLAVVPSARAWLEMPNPPRWGESGAWIAGLPAADLPGVEAEVTAVARILGPERSVCDLKPTAASMRAAGGTADLLHLATHGSLRADNPAFSSIDLADGPLFVHDLAENRFPGRIVVLSACSSGGSASPAGEEWIGIGRGFLLAGVSTVVAPLWPIHEEPTLALLEELYAGLAGGADPVASLGAAWRARCAEADHPWEWAGFGVVGGVAKRSAAM